MADNQAYIRALMHKKASARRKPGAGGLKVAGGIRLKPKGASPSPAAPVQPPRVAKPEKMAPVHPPAAREARATAPAATPPPPRAPPAAAGTEKEKQAAALPEGFFDSAKEEARAKGIDLKKREKEVLEKEWEAFEGFAEELEEEVQRNDEMLQSEYDDRQQRADIEQEVIKLRLEELRTKRARGKRGREEATPAPAADATEGPDHAWSLLTNAMVPEPAIDAEAARDLMRPAGKRRRKEQPQKEEGEGGGEGDYASLVDWRMGSGGGGGR